MNLFPALTNYESAEMIQANNTSGMTGVGRYILNGAPYWTARYGRHARYFNINKYGERRAQQLAIATRQELVDGMEAAFLINRDEGRRESKRHFRSCSQSAIALRTKPISRG